MIYRVVVRAEYLINIEDPTISKIQHRIINNQHDIKLSDSNELDVSEISIAENVSDTDSALAFRPNSFLGGPIMIRNNVGFIKLESAKGKLI